jgi:glycosyltransferase involved in cell wall biosynthesis
MADPLMSDLPLVSIVTPSYNQAAYLEQAIRSVLDQNYPNIEYLVVDGGSTDGSVDIICKYQNRLAWWVSEPDQGQADGINKGLARARGDIVGWLNSDDYYLAGAVARAAAALMTDSHLAMVYSDVLAVNGQGQLINIMRYDDWDLADLMAFNIIGQPGVFMRRSVLQQTGYLDLSYRYILDHHLWLRVARVGRIKYVREQWAAARYHEAAKNVAQASGFGAEAFRLIEWMSVNPDYAMLYQENQSRIWAGAHCFNAHYLLDGGQPFKAFASYMRCFLKYPGVALQEWKRIILCLLTMIGLGKIRSRYVLIRGRLLSKSVK